MEPKVMDQMNSMDILWTFVDILWTFYRGGPQTKGMISVYYIKGWEGEWWLMRMYWIVWDLSMM